MKTEMKIQVRAFLVKIRDERTGTQQEDFIILEKSRLQAGEMVGIGCEELIRRTYNRQGYRVLEVSKPLKKEATIDLAELYFEEEVNGNGKK